MPVQTVYTLPDDPASIVRKNPSMYFRGGAISGKELEIQLLEFVRALGCTEVESLEIAGWHVVRSVQDWFPLARSHMPDDLKCQSLLAAPEWSVNTTRPEALIGALSDRVCVSIGGKVTVQASGIYPPGEMLSAISQAKWQRAIAFAGVH